MSIIIGLNITSSIGSGGNKKLAITDYKNDKSISITQCITVLKILKPMKLVLESLKK
jgi:hypothetical protein